ncbi:MAG: AMP-binding protein [Deltaproteobacteria bacterium]|nr:AMP-binding protein [Deltaproteobacteria bacterium]
MNLAHHLEQSAFFFPDRPAVYQGGVETTYARLNDSANRVATALIKLGVRPGDHIGLCTPNSTDWIIFYFGLLKAGAVAVTLSGMLTGEELATLIHHARPRFLYIAPSKFQEAEGLKQTAGIEKIICSGGDLDFPALMARGSVSFKAVERDPWDTAAILYTGGTTGTPKGVMLTHEGISISSYSVAHFERSTETDRALCFMPFNHVFGQIHIMNATIFSAGCLELLPAFDIDQVMEALEAGRVSKLYAVPTVYIRLLALGDLEKRLGRLRYCFSAAASLAGEVVKQWIDRTGIKISESYGMTEGMPITYNHYHRHKVGSVGQPIFGVEVVGLPDREWGERVTAFIVPKPGFSVSAEELKGFMKSRLSAFKIPKAFIPVKELPKSPTGKILKRKLIKSLNRITTLEERGGLFLGDCPKGNLSPNPGQSSKD